MKTNPNDSAFPFVVDGQATEGVSKREQFAAMAMEGYLASGTFGLKTEQIAEWSVRQADALIAELNKGEV